MVGTAGATAWVGEYADITTWIAHPDELIERASHRVELGDRTYLLEPVDCPELDALVDDVDLTGVIVLMDRHTRDTEAIAARLGLDVFVPDVVPQARSRLDAEIHSLDDALSGTDVEIVSIVERRWWQEVALWLPTTETLVVPEAVGTSVPFTVGDERIGCHPSLRLRPPRRALGGFEPDRLFVGHGSPVDPVDPGEFEHVLSTARRKLPRAWLTSLRATIGRDVRHADP